MSRATVSLTEGSGKNLGTDQRTISALSVQAQYMLQEESAMTTYSVIARDIAIATANDHVLVIMADGTNYTRVKRITIQQSTVGTAGVADLRLFRVSTLGTGGGAVSGRPYDTGDTDPYSGSCFTLPTVKGTEGNQMLQWRIPTVAAVPITAPPNVWPQGYDPTLKPLIIAPGTTNGLAFKIVTGIATVKLDIIVELSQSTYL